ncbi:MAG TPA: nucleotide exchange factor GrpE [Bacteroidales bacterium]|nr:nucleotide exchange factor GrpE [Bacteroidales bacterium]
MMKKKTKEPEENNNKKDNNSADNKEDTKVKEKNDKGGNATGESLENTDDSSVMEDTVMDEADKVIAEKRDLEEKLAEMQDRYIRLSAEFDNYRKRTLREKIEISKYAGEDLLQKIIPIMDDFERALMHMEDSHDESAVKAGVDLIYSKFSEFLKQNGIKEIPARNCDFDVDVHEAVGKFKVEDEKMKGKVVDVVQKGYFIQDKVLRFAKVIVGE